MVWNYSSEEVMLKRKEKRTVATANNTVTEAKDTTCNKIGV